MTLLIGDFIVPNGLAFSPDEKVLYVNDSNPGRKLIKSYTVEANGFEDFVERPGGTHP